MSCETFQSQIIGSKVLIRISWLESWQRRCNCLQWRALAALLLINGSSMSYIREREEFTFTENVNSKNATDIFTEIIHPYFPVRRESLAHLLLCNRRKSGFPSFASSPRSTLVRLLLHHLNVYGKFLYLEMEKDHYILEMEQGDEQRRNTSVVKNKDKMYTVPLSSLIFSTSILITRLKYIAIWLSSERAVVYWGLACLFQTLHSPDLIRSCLVYFN